jgi:hypothetical protein
VPHGWIGELMSKIIPNSFQYPNYYSDELMYLLSGDEQKILLYTVRRIIGFHKDKDNISLTQYSDGITTRSGQQLDYGTGLNRPAVISAIEMLTTCRIITEIKEGHSQDGKCYSLQLDSNKIDLQPLKDRQAKRHQVGQQRTEKARATARAVVSPTDQQAVSPTDQQVVSPTDQQVVSPTDQQVVSPTDQQVVSPTDQQVVSPTDPHVLFSRNTEETKGERQPPPVLDVSAIWQEVFGEPLGFHYQTVLKSESFASEEAFRLVLAIWKQNGYSRRNISGIIQRYGQEFDRLNSVSANSPLQIAPLEIPPGLTPGETKRFIEAHVARQRAA